MFSLKVMGKRFPNTWWNHIHLKKNNLKLSSKQHSIIVLLIVEGWLFLHYCALQVTGERSTVQSVIWFSRNVTCTSRVIHMLSAMPIPLPCQVAWACCKQKMRRYSPPLLLLASWLHPPYHWGTQGSPHHCNPKHETEVGVSTVLFGV